MTISSAKVNGYVWRAETAHAMDYRSFKNMAAKRQHLGLCLFLTIAVTISVAVGTSQVLQDFYAELAELLTEAAGDDEISPLHPEEVPGWPKDMPYLGQITGVAVNHLHQPVLFHRGPHVWDESTFNESHHYQHISKGPIRMDTLITLTSDFGYVVGKTGRDFFYMPHGLTIDKFGNYYVTDVALHQVFKFKPGHSAPQMVFGERFQPGSDIRHLCKPTDVAVASTGDIFIADGYCNSRVLKFDADGNIQGIIPQSQQFLSLRVPHSLALIESEDLLCIADRDNMRVVCPRAGLYGPPPDPRAVLTIQQPDLGLVFAVTSHKGHIYAVNGPTVANIPVRGFTMNPTAEKVVDQWAPKEGFSAPHDVAICPNTSSLYVTETGPNRIWKFKLVQSNLA